MHVNLRIQELTAAMLWNSAPKAYKANASRGYKRDLVLTCSSAKTSLARADYIQHSYPRHRHHVQQPFIIGVAGASASGKTSVCQKLISMLQAEDLEHQGILSISQDSFYRNLTAEEQANIVNFNFDHPSAFAFDEIIGTLRSLKQGYPVSIPVYDFVTSSRVEEHTHVLGADLILFDGILAFWHPELRDLFDIKIFVDTDADTCLARRIKRDIVDRGRDVMQVLRAYEQTVKPSYESYIFPTKKHAHIIVPHGAENAVALEIIMCHLRSKLIHSTPIPRSATMPSFTSVPLAAAGSCSS